MSQLSLAELENNDPRARRGGRERRFLCPFCGADKPRDAAHRSLAANADTGAWLCHRCGAKGLLQEFVRASHHPPVRPASHAALSRAFALSRRETEKPPPVSPPAQAEVPGKEHFQLSWERTQPLVGTFGEVYLAGRGFAAWQVEAAGARYAADFYGRPGVLFPIQQPNGALVAVNARFVDGRDKPKTQTSGPKSSGLYTTPGAWDATVIALTEAPLDAIALWLCGLPAMAMIGTSGPPWLERRLAFKSVILATDADEAGERAAAQLQPGLRARGALVFRLRPTGAKDWAEAWAQEPGLWPDKLWENEALCNFVQLR